MRLESRSFRYKVALYLSYRHIKFDNLQYLVSKVKLTSMLRCIYKFDENMKGNSNVRLLFASLTLAHVGTNADADLRSKSAV